MPKVELKKIAEDWGALPSQVSFVLAQLGTFPEDGYVDVDDETLEVASEEVKGLVQSKTILLAPNATPRDIAAALDLPQSDVQKALMQRSVLATLTTVLDPKVAEETVAGFGYKVQWAEPPKPREKEPEERIRKPVGGGVIRPPVVTIMGHVDHGKTSLLDYIRKTKVAEKEFGGITQHIGAYQVKTEGGTITFLDTPGHEAFTAMRARGAQVTDIAVLVVAADDGVMPQTIEAINHAKTANVPIIVAINKIDKPEANVQRVKQQLVEHGVVSTEFGGDVEMVPVSAATGEGVDHLLEIILLQAEIMELKADPAGEVEGVVIEAKKDKGRGPVATILVQNGTLKKGDVVVVGLTFGRIRAMFDFAGKAVKDAGPSMPVEILGLDDVPNAGDRLSVYLDEKEARERVEQLREEARQKELGETQQHITLADLQRALQEGQTRELRIIVKADVQGSVEAVKGLIDKIENDEVEVKVLHSGVGPIGLNDVNLAEAADAIIVGFNVGIEGRAKKEAERLRIEVRTYKVIYELIEDIEKAVKGMLEPVFEEQYQGTVEVRAVFNLTKVGKVAGCHCTDGKITRSSRVRVKREGETVYEGRVASLKHLKEDVKEVTAGFDCGIQFEGWNDFQEGDVIEAFEVVQVR
ncbi:MAG: translation initiation factor IF-2 [Armatimonadetes bacterium]|nr:MAG: translation initiation factor IF-2 [Armatimonadota bacterium]